MSARLPRRRALAICESVHSVIPSGANPTFQLGALESSMRFFHDRVDEALGVLKGR